MQFDGAINNVLFELVLFKNLAILYNLKMIQNLQNKII